MALPIQWTWVWANSGRWWRREAWHAVIHRVTKSQTQLSNWTTSRVTKSQTPLSNWTTTSEAPGEGHDNPLQYSCLENPMDRRAWWTTVHRVAQSWTRLKQLSMHACISLHNRHCHEEIPQDSKNTLPPASGEAKLKMLWEITIPESFVSPRLYSPSHPGSTSAKSQQSTGKTP